MAKQDNTDRDIDALFALPLAEFTGARNALAARLKSAGKAEEAGRVKELAKPSVSAWAVNQLYWKHRDAWARLLAAGERFRQAQADLLAGKGGGVQKPQEERREAVSQLVRIVAGELETAGHGASPETIRRITTSLEALSVQPALATGRLAEDLEPPGFEALAGLMLAPPSSPPRTAQVIPIDGKRNERQAKVAAAKIAVDDARKIVSDARDRVAEAETGVRRAKAEAATALQQMKEAQARWDKARDTSEAADERVRSKMTSADEAANLLAASERELELKSKELESLLAR